MEHTALLRVDLDALVRNWRLLKATHTGQDCAAVVKANAYGLGVEPVAAALADAGCRHFFVATLEEAIALRQLLTSQFIYVFNGVQANEAQSFLEFNIIPVLNSLPQFERWEHAVTHISAAPAVLHIDTGMNRLGLSLDEAEKLAMEPERVERAHIRMLMSHLACASEPNHPLNVQQAVDFQRMRQCFPTLTASFANSAGIFLGTRYHHNIGRPGCALYGINPHDARPSPVEHVATLSAPILQCRSTKHDNEPVGYGAETTVAKGTRIATIALGYADGLQRILSNTTFGGYVDDHYAPLLGRVSMDLVMLDVSRLPEQFCQPGQRLSFINEQQDVNVIASLSQTIGYEVFTRLGRRVHRDYIGTGHSELN